MKKKESDKTIESVLATSRKTFRRTLLLFCLSWIILIPSLYFAERFRIGHPGKAWPWDNNSPTYWYHWTMWLGEISMVLSGLKLYYLNEDND